MKKVEAQLLAPEKSKLCIEYITQILSDPEKLNANMNFTVANKNMLALDIYVPKRNFERHLKLDITTDHSLVLYEQFLNDLLDAFLEHETMGVTRYYMIKFSIKGNFSGVSAVNSLGSRIDINFNCSGADFNEITSKYNKRIDDYLKLTHKENKRK